MITATRALDTGAFVIDRMREQPRRRREREQLAQTARRAYLAAGGSSPTGGEWVWNSHRATWIRKDSVVKVARGAYGETSLRRDLAVRTHIHTDPTTASWKHQVARTYWAGDCLGRFTVVEQRLPGAQLVDLMHDTGVLAKVVDELSELRRSTSHQVVADDRLFSWFQGPAWTVSGILRRWGDRRAADTVTAWAADTAAAMQGCTCRVALVHGDLWPGNILLRHGSVAGLIDWDQAAFHDAALHDVLHLTVYPAVRGRGLDLGLVIREALTDRTTKGELGELLRGSGVTQDCRDVGMSLRNALIWYWLRHVARMAREPGHANNPRWVANNVVAVATALEEGERK